MLGPRIFNQYAEDVSELTIQSASLTPSFVSERELAFTIAICYQPSVCCLSVKLVHPTQAVELFGNFFHHTIAQGLYFSGAKHRWWGTPLSP